MVQNILINSLNCDGVCGQKLKFFALLIFSCEIPENILIFQRTSLSLHKNVMSLRRIYSIKLILVIRHNPIFVWTLRVFILGLLVAITMGLLSDC